MPDEIDILKRRLANAIRAAHAFKVERDIARRERDEFKRQKSYWSHEAAIFKNELAKYVGRTT